MPRIQLEGSAVEPEAAAEPQAAVTLFCCGQGESDSAALMEALATDYCRAAQLKLAASSMLPLPL